MNALWVKLAKDLQGSGTQLPVLAFGEDRPSIHTSGNSMPSLSPRQLDPHKARGTEERERECQRKGWSEGAVGNVLSRGKEKPRGRKEQYLSMKC